ncbi:MAG: trehalose utilization protein ThuA, partial [Verrucomicrobiota bacterium]|nr:trehalose utilization protein ThuA [Verrucomicrobiota bacterium]
MPRKLRVTVWGENVHERKNLIVRSIYPTGMHTTIAEGIAEKGEFDVRTATLQQPQHGLTKAALDETDVLVWWGHAAHGKVHDRVVDDVLAR